MTLPKGHDRDKDNNSKYCDSKKSDSNDDNRIDDYDMKIQPALTKDEPSVKVYAVFYPLLLLVIIPLGSALVLPILFEPITALSIAILPTSLSVVIFYFVYELRYGNFIFPIAKWFARVIFSWDPKFYKKISSLIYSSRTKHNKIQVNLYKVLNRILLMYSSRTKHNKIQVNLYEVLNRILYAEIVVLVGAFSILIFTPRDLPLEMFTSIMVYFLTIELAAAGSIYAILAFILPSYLRRDFRFIMAQKCMHVAGKDEENQAEKIKYLLDALCSYNKYLKRNFNLEFDDTRVASIIISSPVKNKEVKKIEESFTDNCDKLKPVVCLSRLANLEPREQFLVNKQLSTKIKEICIFLATIIPVLITVIQLVFPQYFQKSQG